MSFGRTHNIGSTITPRRACDHGAITAGGAGDNTLITGQIIDTMALGSGSASKALSARLSILWKAILGASATLTLKSITIEHGAASNLSDAATFQSVAVDPVVATGAGTFRGEQNVDIDLAGCKQYVRLKVTPDLSAANTDTAEISAAFVFGGLDIVP